MIDGKVKYRRPTPEELELLREPFRLGYLLVVNLVIDCLMFCL